MFPPRNTIRLDEGVIFFLTTDSGDVTNPWIY